MNKNFKLLAFIFAALFMMQPIAYAAGQTETPAEPSRIPPEPSQAQAEPSQSGEIPGGVYPNSDIREITKLFEQMTAEEIKAARETAHLGRESINESIMEAADKLRANATSRMIAGMVAGAVQLANGVVISNGIHNPGISNTNEISQIKQMSAHLLLENMQSGISNAPGRVGADTSTGFPDEAMTETHNQDSQGDVRNEIEQKMKGILENLQNIQEVTRRAIANP
jgi:hypothetical protein